MLKGRKLYEREGLLLELFGENDATGLGEASPLPGFSRETTGEAARQLSYLASSLVGEDLTPAGLSSNDGPVRGPLQAGLSPSVRFGVESAVYDLHAANEGETLAGLIGAPPVTSVPVNGLLSGSFREVLGEARRFREAGYEAVKLKIGSRKVEEDAGLVRSVRGVLGGGVALRLDANRAWTFEVAAAFARAVADVRFEYLEEPLADPSGLARFAGECKVPVALDESLVGMPPGDLAGHHYARAVVIKPTMVGGISWTLRLAEEARRAGMSPVVSSAYETGVGMQVLVALSAATGGGKVAVGLDTYRQLEQDVLEPSLDIKASRIDISRVSCVKRELRRDLLKVLASSRG